jgi:hypothetical protein
MATVEGYPADSSGPDPFPNTLGPYLGAVMVRDFAVLHLASFSIK